MELEYNEEYLKKLLLEQLLRINDFCIIKIRRLSSMQEIIEGSYYSGYEYNKMGRDMGYLQYIRQIIKAEVKERLDTRTNINPFNNPAIIQLLLEILNVDDLLGMNHYDLDFIYQDYENKNSIYNLIITLFPDYQRRFES